jgi:hypothetical protein
MTAFFLLDRTIVPANPGRGTYVAGTLIPYRLNINRKIVEPNSEWDGILPLAP